MYIDIQRSQWEETIKKYDEQQDIHMYTTMDTEQSQNHRTTTTLTMATTATTTTATTTTHNHICKTPTHMQFLSFFFGWLRRRRVK